MKYKRVSPLILEKIQYKENEIAELKAQHQVEKAKIRKSVATKLRRVVDGRTTPLSHVNDFVKLR